MNNQQECELEYRKRIPQYFDNACGTTNDKMANFTKFTSRQTLAIFLYKYELYKQILNQHGSIIECGVHHGGGTMTFAQLSSILEPYNYQRKVFGFDTFEGFPEITNEDLTTSRGRDVAKVGAFNVNGIESDLEECIKLYDLNRPLAHVKKVEFIKGDINDTLPKFIEGNPHLIISLLYLDMDIYKPTKKVLEMLVSRVPKGGIIAFDEVNNPDWPGETQALHEILGINNVRLMKFPFEPVRSYMVVE